ncbi:hypothetical protein ACFU6S_07105 [Streptomyces sp. NPDC057456]|uniref:hypothetical protein n=1 Tax=Streptomyces sp. NPDC057456 TaxID=3346139 RepID=UPI003694FAE6
MRLCPPVSLCLAVAAALLPAPAHAEAGPSCAAPDGSGFPLTTRLHGGPASYRAGGGYGVWYLDLTNTTRLTCDGIHPVVVLVDAGRVLKPSQARLEFYADGQPHPVRFEPTDDDELVGAFTDGPTATDDEAQTDGRADGRADGTDRFPGFTVGPGRTLTVKLRLALTSDTAPNDVTANAAVVQRHGDDGDWIGQSNDYRFAVEAEPRPGTAPAPDPDVDPDTDTAPGLDPSAPTPDRTHTATAPTSATPVSPAPVASAADTGRLSLADEAEELARTGLTSPAVLVGATVCLLAAGTVLLLARRQARRRR